MFGSTVAYKSGSLHLIAAPWSEENIMCVTGGAHTVVGLSEFWSPEDFARSVRADPASMNALRELVFQHTNRQLSTHLSDPQVLRQTAVLLAEGRLKAVFCASESVHNAATPVAHLHRFHLQLGLGGHVGCSYALGHELRHWNDATLLQEFLDAVFENEHAVKELRRVLSHGGEPASDDDNAALQRDVERLIRTGRLHVIECTFANWPGVDDGADKEAERLRAQQAQRQPAKDTTKTTPAKTWIEIRLVDKKGTPVPNRRYKITLPDRTVIEGNLDEHGHARQEGIDPGSCQVTFPDIDGREWHAA